MDEDPDGNKPQTTERTQQVTGWLRIKPVDDVSFTEDDERLQRQVRDRQVRERQTVDRFSPNDVKKFHSDWFIKEALDRYAIMHFQ